MVGYPDKYHLLEMVRENTEMVANFFERIPIEIFFKKNGNGWSAGENLIHLHKSTLPVSLSLITPKILLRMMFGTESEIKEPLEIMKRLYFSKLQSGAHAGIFTPQIIVEGRMNPNEKAKLLKKWNDLSCEYILRIGKWTDKEMSECNLPHPILGKISVKQIICFSVFHNEHHVQNVRMKLQDQA